ncbi:Bis(5'-adenosyl)-triphosphatase [Intoshia linei]|uniref:bis(5'-adenosyl)-triphosphatase n=1 Tax=Intoshia linei TaxID=1819745 RepID=A0A177AVM9_9BILA|nr:Bis(5'-adenosyl)-triphosphatase [Intoshia linei]
MINLRQLSKMSKGTQFFKTNINEKLMFSNHVIPPSHIFAHSKYSFAFVNISPVVIGHVLISTKRTSVYKFNDLREEELTDIFKLTQYVGKALDLRYGTDSKNISIQDGSDAGQSVKHLHIHLLPRRHKDFDCIDGIYDKLHKHDKQERTLQSSLEMEIDATEMKKFMEICK